MKVKTGYYLSLAAGALIGAAAVSLIPNPRTDAQSSQAMVSAERNAWNQPTLRPSPSQVTPKTSDAPTAETPALLASLKALDEGAFTEVERELQESYLSLMIDKLGRSNPAAAADLLETIPTKLRDELAPNLAYAWSQRDAPGALAWLLGKQGSFESDAYDTSLFSVLANYAKVEPALVASQYVTLLNEEHRDALWGDIASSWADRDMEGALNWLANLPPSELSAKAMTESYLEVMQRYVTVNPAAAAATIELLESQSLREQLVPSVALELAREDFQAAVEWTLGFPELEVRRLGMMHLVESEFANAPDKVLDILLSVEDLYQSEEYYAADLYRKLIDSNPALLQQRFEEIPISAQASIAESLAIAGFENKDTLENTIDWIESLPRGAAFDGGARVLASHLSKQDPTQAVRWALRLSSKAERYELVNDIIAQAPAADLPNLAGVLNSTLALQDESGSFQALLDKRIANDFSTLVLP